MKEEPAGDGVLDAGDSFRCRWLGARLLCVVPLSLRCQEERGKMEVRLYPRIKGMRFRLNLIFHGSDRYPIKNKFQVRFSGLLS
jgi:hypothetical protein